MNEQEFKLDVIAKLSVLETKVDSILASESNKPNCRQEEHSAAIKVNRRLIFMLLGVIVATTLKGVIA